MNELNNFYLCYGSTEFYFIKSVTVSVKYTKKEYIRKLKYNTELYD